MIIRCAKPEDAARIADLWNWAVRETLITFTTEEKSETGVAADIDARGPLFMVAEDAPWFAGFATAGPFRAGPGYAGTLEITIMLTEDARGKGIGRALIAALEDTARAAGIHVLVAAVSSANPGAVRFHERVGFKQAGTFREVGRKWDRWLDAVFLQKILAP